MRRYLSDQDLPEIYNHINNAVYSVIDGNVEIISNNKSTYVRDYGFYKHENLKQVNFSTATSINDFAFYQCSSLETVNIPLATNIGAFAFKGCSSIQSIDFGNVTTVGNGTFDECTKLSSATFTNLQSIPALMFRKCDLLTTVDLPVATNIGTQAFYSSGITSLTLRSNTMCTLENADAFYFTPIEEGTGYIYVPSNLVNTYKADAKWSVYANQIRAIS